MKLALDTHHLLLEHAGTKRVTVNLIEQFKKTPGVELVLLSPSYPLKRGDSAFEKIAGHITRFFWVHIHLPYLCRKNNIDFLFSPEFNTPLFTHCKRAVIAHDAHMRAQRAYTSSLWFFLYYIPFIELAIRQADLIFTVSRFSKKQVVELMRLNEDKVVVAYNGVDKQFLLTDSATDLNLLPAGLTAGKYILFVGTFETRKNIERLIKAFAKARSKNAYLADFKLAISGNAAISKFSDRSRQIHQLIKDSNIIDAVVLCGFVPDEGLPALYRNASIIAFPSLQEGFGFPIIEGFASGVPVLTSNVCSMPEIAGDAALLVDPYDIDDMAQKIEELILDPILRKKLIKEGLKRVDEFTWEKCAGLIVESLLAELKR